jgi:hypothetical protein
VSGAGGASPVPCAACAEAGAAGSSGAAGDAAAQAGTAAVPSAAGAADAGDAAGAAGAAGASLADDGVAISEVSFWQTLRVPLEISGAAAAPSAPIIAGKAGILRVYVSPGLSFRARALSVALAFSAPGGAPFVSTKLIRAASDDRAFSTTFNFPIDAEDVLADATYSVVLQDGVGGAELDRYPTTGHSALGPVSAGNTLNVVVVPIVVGGVVPDVSPGILATFRARVLSMYPLADLTLTTHAPLESSVAVLPDSGWDETLDALYALRAQDAPADNVYYYGLFTPTQRYGDYCTKDCTVGLSQIAAPDEVEYRGSIGLGVFADGSNSDAPDTMAHEIGHALGRRHAPCMTPDPGPFPYPGGKIGVWGFDSLHHLLLDPKTYADVMGYCAPDWISDFTYSALFSRIEHVNATAGGATAFRLGRPEPAFRRVLVNALGGLRWGSAFTPKHAPRGDAREVRLLGADGTALASATGYYQPYGDGPGGFLLVPLAALDARTGISRIRVGSAELSLAAPMP